MNVGRLVEAENAAGSSAGRTESADGVIATARPTRDMRSAASGRRDLERDLAAAVGSSAVVRATAPFGGRSASVHRSTAVAPPRAHDE